MTTLKQNLLISGSLAAGEYLAAMSTLHSTHWPVALICSILIAFIGYGLSHRIWPYLAIFFFGVGLYWHGIDSKEQDLRLRPWMRGRREHVYETPAQSHRHDFSQRVRLGLRHDPEIAALNCAMLLGERRSMSAQTKKAFVDSGSMHVFAISGLHVMAVGTVFYLVLRLMFVPSRMACAASLPLLYGYVWMIGAPASAVRAGVMMTIYGLSAMAWRRVDWLRSWTVAFVGLHILNPTQLTDVGNVLSFVVMLAIILAAKTMPARNSLLNLAWVSAFAWAAAVPVAGCVFGQVTLGGLFANFVLVFLAQFSVFAGVLGVMSSFGSLALAAHFNNLSALVTKAMVTIAELISTIPGQNLEVSNWSHLQCLSWYLSMAGVLYLANNARQRQKLMIG